MVRILVNPDKPNKPNKPDKPSILINSHDFNDCMIFDPYILPITITSPILGARPTIEINTIIVESEKINMKKCCCIRCARPGYQCEGKVLKNRGVCAKCKNSRCMCTRCGQPERPKVGGPKKCNCKGGTSYTFKEQRKKEKQASKILLELFNNIP